MLSADAIDLAYCFFHQKWRVYAHSTMDWQKDDIEVAIADYADTMDAELYSRLSQGRSDYLRAHQTFSADICHALEVLESLQKQQA